MKQKAFRRAVSACPFASISQISSRAFVGLTAVAVITASQPALADDSDSDTEKVALLSYLGLEAAKGETSLGDKAGELEGYILAAGLLDQSANMATLTVAQWYLWKNTHTPLLNGAPLTLVPLADDQKLDIQAYSTAKIRITTLRGRWDAVARGASVAEVCKPKPKDGNKNDGVTTEAVTPVLKLSDLVGAVKTDTAISSVAVSPPAQMVINALASKRAVSIGENKVLLNWIIPSEIGIAPNPSALVADLSRLMNDAAPYTKEACREPYKSLANDVLKAGAAITAGGEGGKPSLLESAVFIESAGLANSDFRVLRISVPKAGGTVVNKSNIFTTLGLPGLTMSGGLIVTLRLVNPATGAVEFSGSLVCSVPKQQFGKISKNEGLPAGTCKPIGLPTYS